MPTVNLGRVGFVNKGDYVEASPYKLNDIVTANKAVYACIQAVPTNSGITISNESYWQKWLDNKIALNQAVTVTPLLDADYTLTTVENTFGRFVLDLSNWTTTHNIIVDDTERSFLVDNSTGTHITATVKTSAGTGIDVPAGAKFWLLCDGVNVIESTSIGNPVSLIGNQTIDGIKTFTSSPIVPTPTADFQVANKTYVDNAVDNAADIVTWKTQVFPNWIADAGSGVPFAYGKDAIVTYTDGRAYVSLVDANTGEPSVSNDWALANFVKQNGDETIAGIKTFSSSPIVPTPTTDFQSATKKYVDDVVDAMLYIISRPTKASPTSIIVDGVTLDLTTYYPTPIAGTDYFIQHIDGVYSISDTQDTDTIGGFHYSLVGHTQAPTGNKTEADMVLLRGINAYSIWTKWFRPKEANPRGMAYIPELGYWIDIYLMDNLYANRSYPLAGSTIAGGVQDANGRLFPVIPTMFGGDGSTTYGKLTPFVAWDIANAAKKKLIPYKDFTIAAYGVNEGKSLQTNGYETVVGKIEHYPELLSRYGIEQATGVQWIWGADFGSSASGAWSNIADGRGQVHQNANAVILGGSRDDGVNAGSRASNWSSTLSYAHWSIGCRLACDHFELA